MARGGPSWSDRRSGLATPQALARARRFCCFFFRAARMRAVFFRRLGARCFAGIAASYQSRDDYCCIDDHWGRWHNSIGTREAGRRFAHAPFWPPPSRARAPARLHGRMASTVSASIFSDRKDDVHRATVRRSPALFATTASRGFPGRPFFPGCLRSAGVAESLGPDLEVPSVRHRRGSLPRVLGDVRDERLGGREERGDRRRVLQRDPLHLGRVDDSDPARSARPGGRSRPAGHPAFRAMTMS